MDKLTDKTIIIDGHILHRIQALKDFNLVAKGDLGGFVESEKIFLIKEIVGFMIMLKYMTML